LIYYNSFWDEGIFKNKASDIILNIEYLLCNAGEEEDPAGMTLIGREMIRGWMGWIISIDSAIQAAAAAISLLLLSFGQFLEVAPFRSKKKN
jgi:hypothetical protein